MFESSALAQVLVSGIGVGCIYGLIAIGFCVIYNASGIVNFSQGAFVMLGGMLTHFFMTYYNFPMPVAAVTAVVLVVVVGVAIERLVVRPLWNRNASMFAMILATLAVQIVVERATLLFLGDQPKALPVFTDLPPIMLGSVAVSYQLLWNVGASILLVVILGVFFKRTLIGKALRACAVDRQAAQLQGIPVSRMLSLAFAISAGLGAIAGILIAPTQYTAFNVGTPFAISGFIAAIIGGFGRPVGAFAGGLVLGVSQSFASVAFGSGQKNIAALTILLIFLFFRPSGIMGKAADK
ncbi:branched-chain amino acid ABC transporter permease [Phyllobacterium sp. SB3]|uniref:branched-chain amino acid ABC transporter permease n=1 Tax=Phyllobacterium sp. SB3 TaxID=3156073 RepID=UPI0032AF8A38